MATPFEYRPIPPHGAPRLARISDNTNHPKYSLSLPFSVSPSLSLSLCTLSFVPAFSLSFPLPSAFSLSLSPSLCSRVVCRLSLPEWY